MSCKANRRESSKIVYYVIEGVILPFLGTALGAACVFFMRGRQFNRDMQRGLIGFAAGVMVAASVWSLLIPAMERSAYMGRYAFVPAVVGFWLGVAFLLLLDRLIPYLHQNNAAGGKLSRTSMMILAVVLHNLPEGMAVGAVFAGFMADSGSLPLAGAMALSLGIAIQNVPEGAIISMPLSAKGMGKGKAMACGIASGAVEPLGAALTILAAGYMVPALPFFLSFAAGAMLYVVAQELIPEMTEGSDSKQGTIFFSAGFTVMMALDVMLG